MNNASATFDGTTSVTFHVSSTNQGASQWSLFAETSMNVTYFHCEAGEFWDSEECKLCTVAELEGNGVSFGRGVEERE